MKVDLKILNPKIKVPIRAHEEDAGYDLYASIEEPIVIRSGETVKVPTGIAVALPNDTFGGVFARSGLATNMGLRPANCIGVIDANYRGEIIVPIHNDANRTRFIHPYDKIAQLIIIPFVKVDFNEVKKLNETDRADGGFGSTGV